MKKKIIILITFIIITIAISYNFTNKDKKNLNTAVNYSLTVTNDDKIIDNNLIELDSNNNMNFEVEFSAEKNNYIGDFDSYDLYVMVNFKKIEFSVDNNYDNFYSFQLSKTNTSKKINISASLNEIDDPSTIIVSILPKEFNINNYNHGMIFLYDIKKNNEIIKNDYKYTEYETVINNDYKGMILSKDFDSNKESGFDLIKNLNVNKEENVKLAFRASNITNNIVKNKDYILLISLNGVVDDKNIYIFKEPALSEIIYKELIIELNEDINDIVAYLIPIDSRGQEFNQYYIIQRIIINSN